jgi:hypothetical protein
LDVLSALRYSNATGFAHVSQAAQMALPALPPRSVQPRKVPAIKVSCLDAARRRRVENSLAILTEWNERSSF